ncbi:MAG: metallophosphoesterase family protein [Gaiellaceae bacterium]
MRVAALYDIHGNLPALEAVLAAVASSPPDAIVVGGDVLWGPYQAECVELLRDVGALFLAGNCERAVLYEDSDADRWCRGQLDAGLLADVATWPATIELDVDGLGRVLFCHATPRSDDEIITRLTPDVAVADAFSGTGADVVVCGHTHVQVDRAVPGAPRLVNAGSVGMPCEGKPGAFWALLDVRVDLRKTAYDVESAIARLAESSFPAVENVFFEQVRGEVTAESASEYFEGLRGA